MPVKEKLRANISLVNDPPNNDYDSILKLKHILEHQQGKILTLVEVVRIALQHSIKNFK